MKPCHTIIVSLAGDIGLNLLARRLRCLCPQRLKGQNRGRILESEVAHGESDSNPV